jgi:hypothetical protein
MRECGKQTHVVVVVASESAWCTVWIEKNAEHARTYTPNPGGSINLHLRAGLMDRGLWPCGDGAATTTPPGPRPYFTFGRHAALTNGDA